MAFCQPHCSLQAHSHSDSQQAEKQAFGEDHEENLWRRETEGLQDGVFSHSILHGHQGCCRHQAEDQSQAGVSQVACHLDHLGQVSQTLGLKSAFGTRVGGHRTIAKGIVDLTCHG